MSGSADTNPTGFSVAPETESGCSVNSFLLLVLCCFHREEEDEENERKRNEPVRKKQNLCTLEAACEHVYTKAFSSMVVGVT